MTAFDNSQVREVEIWVPFLNYGFYNTVQEAERAVIFGLYSNSFRNNDAYLQDVSAIELANILAEYNNKMAALDVDRQKLVMSLIVKRYVASLEKLLHDEKMVTELQKINAASSEWDAKFAALAADRAALETLRIKIASEIKRISARIEELKAYIALETAQLALVDIDIAEKNLSKAGKDLQLASKDLELAKKDVALLNVANEIARIQLQIVEAGLEWVEVDLKVARTEIDIAQAENQIAKLGLAESELEVAEAKTAAERADLETYDAKIELAEMQVDSVDKEIKSVQAATEDDKEIQEAKVESVYAKQAVHLQTITNQYEQRVFGIQEREVSVNMEKAITELGNKTQGLLDADRMREGDAHKDAAWTSADGAIRAAEIMAIANVTTALTHLIKKA